MSRPGDETKVGSQLHRQHNQRLRQLEVKSGAPSLSLIANVRGDTTSASTANGGPGGNRRTAPTASPSPAFLCRCPVDADEVERTPVRRRGHPQCCAAVESLRPELAAILAEVRCVTRKLREDEWNDDQTSDWKFAAMVIDRLSFWTLTVYLVIVTVAVFGSGLPH